MKKDRMLLLAGLTVFVFSIIVATRTGLSDSLKGSLMGIGIGLLFLSLVVTIKKRKQYD